MTEIGQLSLYLVTGAMTAYLIALIAFSIDLTRTAPVRASRPRELAAVSAGGGDVAEAGVTPSGVPSEPDSHGSGPTAPVRRRAAGIGVATYTVGTLLLVAGVVTRGFAAGRVPWANMYEFTITAVAVSALVFLGISRRRDVRYLGTFLAGAGVLALFLALAALYTEPAAVQPALQSYWLVIHVAVAISATGTLGVGAGFSVLQLLKERAQDRGRPGGRVVGALPPAAELERIAYRLNAVGFVLWTFTLIAGAIWAEHAWGRYWGWDAKEVGTFVVWVIYAAYLHARATRGWEGRRAGWFSIAGFLALLANYYVVNLFASSLHSYSGV